MKEYAILMGIFGVCVFLYGFFVYFDKDPLLPKVYKKPTEAYRKFLAKTIMFVSTSFLLSAFIAFLGDNGIICALSFLVLIVGFGVEIYLANRYFKK